VFLVLDMEDQAAGNNSVPPPAPAAGEQDRAVLQGLLTGLIGAFPDEEPKALTLEIVPPEEPEPPARQPPPLLDSSANISDFIEGLRRLVEAHGERSSPQLSGSFSGIRQIESADPLLVWNEPVPEEFGEAPVPAADEESHSSEPLPVEPNLEFQEVAGGLLAELLQSTDENLLVEPHLARLPEPLPQPATALTLLGIATSLGDFSSDLEEEPSPGVAAHQPAGPFESLLDAIDSELGPRPEFHAAHAVPEIASGGRYVTFELADDWYALPLERVLETDRLTRHTFVPGMPAYFLGVINLRGEILPLVDLRTLLGFEDATFEGRMLIVEDPANNQRYAFRVDRLAGIVSIPPEDISQPLPPDLDDEEDADPDDEEAPEPAVAGRIAPLLRGVAFPGTQSVHILDTGKLLAVATGEVLDDPMRTESLCRK
jgi:purine-binding chemotaxis protein CheW